MIPTLHHVAHLLHAKVWKAFGEPAFRAIWGHPRITGAVTAAILLAIGGIRWFIVAHRPPAEELERRRREYLTKEGRVTDGLILDARTLSGEESLEPTPEVLVYSYRLAGVIYNCAQDVSMLPEQVRGYRLDLPVSVRYDPRHPGNSILVSETWSGLWGVKANKTGPREII